MAVAVKEREATASATRPLRRKEAAERLGVHPNTVMSWGARSWLETVLLPGGETRYTVSSVEALREQIYGDSA